MRGARAASRPARHDKRSVLVNSGAEAVENAVKIARRATGRPAVLVLDHAYHGRTNLTMAMTARAMPYKTGFGPFAGEVYRVPGVLPAARPRGDDRRAGGAARHRRGRAAGGRRPGGRARRRADPRRGRVRRPGAGVPADARRVGGRPRDRARRRRGADRVRAHGRDVRHASTRASSPTSSPWPRASRAGCRSARSPAAPSCSTPCTRAGSAARSAATRSRARRRWRRSRSTSATTWRPPRARSRRRSSPA